MTTTRSATRARMIVRVVIGLALLAMAAFEAIPVTGPDQRVSMSF